MVTVYTIKKGRLAVLFEESGEKVYGLIVFRKKRAPPIIISGKEEKSFHDSCDQVILVDLVAGVFLPWSGLPDPLFDAILKRPTEFMMEKVGEESGVAVLACYHPYLVKAIGEKRRELGDLLLKNEAIRQKILDSTAVWQLVTEHQESGGNVYAIMPCTSELYVSKECGVDIFKKDLVLYELGVDERAMEFDDIEECHRYYCASNHPFYHDLFLLAALDLPAAKDCLKMALKEGIDATQPFLRSTLNEKILEKGIADLYSCSWRQL